jgi:hypothetical protein
VLKIEPSLPLTVGLGKAGAKQRPREFSAVQTSSRCYAS